MKRLLCLIAVPLLVVLGCSPPPKSSGLIGKAATGGTSSNNGGGSGEVHTDKFEQTVIKDGADDAATYTAPAGWTHKDTLQWANAGIPYPVIAAITFSPDKQFGFGWIPMLGFVYNSGPMGANGQEIENSVAAIELLAKAGKLSNFQILEKETKPLDSNYPAMQGTQPSAEITTARCSWADEGGEKEGVYIVKMDTTRMDTSGSKTQLTFLTVLVFSAPKGKVTDPTFLRYAAVFMKSCVVPAAYNAKINQGAWNSAQESRKIALQQSDDIMNRYWKQQDSNEQRAQDFDNYIKGVEEQSGPGGQKYIVPSSGQNWIGQNGQIINSNDPNYDPNNDPNGGGGGWNKMQGG